MTGDARAPAGGVTTTGGSSHPDRRSLAVTRPILARHDFVSVAGRYLRVYGELRGQPPVDLPAVEPAALHQRHDALTDSWVAISPARNVRPHTSQPSTAIDAAASGLRPACPLCPGGPEIPFSYDAAVFDNRFPSLVPDPPLPPPCAEYAPSLGRCEVVLYTEHHIGSLATLSPLELARVVAVWRDRTGELWADPNHRFVMAFENRGEAVGTTIAHPHGQIYAFDRLPPFIAVRVAALARHRGENGGCLSCAVVAQDAGSERVVGDGRSFVVAVPFAPRWPFEVHVRARRHGLRRLTDLELDEQHDLAAVLREVVQRYDGLFGFELPYMMVALEAPEDAPDWHLAFEFLPPHRTARLKKVRASVETATGLFINDTLPESNAARLAAVGVVPREEAPPLIVEVQR